MLVYNRMLLWHHIALPTQSLMSDGSFDRNAKPRESKGGSFSLSSNRTSKHSRGSQHGIKNLVFRDLEF